MLGRDNKYYFTCLHFTCKKYGYIITKKYRIKRFWEILNIQAYFLLKRENPFIADGL